MKKLLLALCLGLLSVGLFGDLSTRCHIQRTLQKAAEGTPEKPAVVRLMFYGQSITYGSWTNMLTDELRQKYPNAIFQVVNAAMGSAESNWLINTAEHDLYYYYPDLVIIHTYGSTQTFAKIIEKLRFTTTADILMWTSHPSYAKQQDGSMAPTPMLERLKALKDIAMTYKTGLVDIRKHWDQHCKEKGTNGAELMGDAVHPNTDGNKLFAKIFAEYLTFNPSIKPSGVSGEIYTPDATVQPDGAITVDFEGNYLTCQSPEGTYPVPVKLFLDGKPVEQCPELYHIQRPDGFITERPALLTVGKKGLLREENWTINFLEDSEPKGKRVHFRLTGSLSGFQGEGWSDQDFTSSNGALFFGKDKWINTFMFIYWPKQLENTYPAKCKITFQSFPTFPNTIPATNQLRFNRHVRFFGERNDNKMPTVLIQGVDNAKHSLKIIPEADAKLPRLTFTAHKPPQQ